jgi:multicomponent Na+:H+ antiporter subunit D
MHLAAHAMSKITLFFAAGSIYTAAHLTEVSQLDGIGRRMPWTMAAFTVGALAMIGVPPTAGFLGKWFMLTGAMQTANWIALVVIVVSTILNAGYFLPIVFRAFFRAPTSHGGHDSGEAPWPIVVALTATAIGTVLMFLAPQIPYALATLMGRS